MRTYINLPSDVPVESVVLFSKNAIGFVIPEHTRSLVVETSRDAFRNTMCTSCNHYRVVRDIRQALVSEGITVTAGAVQEYIAENKLCLASDNDISTEIPCHSGLLYEEFVTIDNVTIPRSLAVIGKKGTKSNFYLGALGSDDINAETELLKIDIGNIANDLSLCLSTNSKDFSKSDLGTVIGFYFSSPFNNSLSLPGVDLESVIRGGHLVNSSISIPLSKLVNTDEISVVQVNQSYLPNYQVVGLLVSNEDFDLEQHNAEGEVLSLEALNTAANIVQYVDHQENEVLFYKRASLSNSKMNSEYLFSFDI